MFRYADPESCPVCRAAIPYAATRCDACSSSLSGTTAASLFRTLTHADQLVAQLRAVAAAPPAPARVAPVPAPTASSLAGPAPAAVSAPSTAVGGHSTLPPNHPSFPVPQRPGGPTPDRQRGLSAASIPRILLGLGATCLLVAALVFLAVTWTVLGVGGRTVTLIALTTAAGGASAWLVSRGLRGGAEAFTCVTAGLVVLDLFGLQAAGWLDTSAEAFLVVLGATLSTLGLCAGHVVHQTRRGHLVAAEVVGGLGVMTIGIGFLVSPWWGGVTGALLVATLLAVATAVASHRVDLGFAAATLGTGSLLWWISLVMSGLGRFDDTPTMVEVWSRFEAWPLLSAAAIALVPAARRVLTVGVRVAFGAAAVALLSLVVTLPAFDESASVETSVQLVVVALAALAVVRLARPWRWLVVVPLVTAGLGLFRGAVALASDALEPLLDHGTWSNDAGASLVTAAHPWHLPLLLPVATFGVLVALWASLRMRTDLAPAPLLAPFALVAVATAALVPAMYGVPLAVAVLVLLSCGLGTLAVAVLAARLPVRATAYGLAAVLGLLTLGAATASDVLTALTTGVYAVVALVAAHARSDEARGLGDFGFPPSVAGFAWAALHLAEVTAAWRTVPVLVLLGLWIILRPAVAREISAAVVAAAVVTLGTTSPTGVDQSWLAIDLTLAGVLVTVSALIHPTRRRLGWVGLGLLTLAQWTRMQEVGVSTVEAYTLPLALVLLTVGVIRMLRTPVDSVTALTPGLVLALAPTMAMVLVDPVSARAALLGLGCLVAIAVGGALGWSAPLVAGGAFGLLLVLREAVHAQVLQQWITIGLVGLALTIVGVTWERRLSEIRVATAFLRRLR